MVKNLPSNAGDLGREDATHCSVLVWEIPKDRGTWWVMPHKRVRHDLET